MKNNKILCFFHDGKSARLENEHDKFKGNLCQPLTN
jgi:hypothetical protein